MRTISELRTRAWYRFIQVITIFLFVSISILTSIIVATELWPYESLDMQESHIYCTNYPDRIASFESIEEYLTYLNLIKIGEAPAGRISQENYYKTIDWVIAFCEFDYIKIFAGSNDQDEVYRYKQIGLSEAFDFTEVGKTNGSWYSVLLAVTLIFLFFFGLLTALKRVLYYIILGSFNPSK